MRLTVAQRLAALAEGKKLRQPSFDAGKYVELKDDHLVNHVGDAYSYSEFLMNPQWSWELYTEPQKPTVLECQVAFFEYSSPECYPVGFVFNNLKPIHVEHVRVELPSKALTEAEFIRNGGDPLDGKSVSFHSKPATQTHEFWVNTYPDNNYGIYYSKEFANYCKASDYIACKRVVVSFKEGDTE